MENTTSATAAEGVWRSEPLPEIDRPVTFRKGSDADYRFGYRLTVGMTTSLEAEFGGLPPSAFSSAYEITGSDPGV